MAQITIRELDLTGNPAASVFDVAFVPGLTVNDLTELDENGKRKFRYDYGKPYYFNSLSSFQAAMGNQPVLLTGSGIKATINGEEKTFFAEGEGVFDNGYIYAAELLSKGMPIYYMPIAGSSAQDLYDALEGKPVTSFDSNSASSEVAYDESTNKLTITASFQDVDANASVMSIVSFNDAGSTTEDSTPEIITDETTIPATLGDGEDSSETVEGIGKFTVQDDAYTFSFKDGVLTIEIDGEAHIIPENKDIDILYAKNLASSNIEVEVKVKGVPANSEEEANAENSEETQEVITEPIPSVLLQLVDRGTFNIKYLTSGGYPTFEYDNNAIVKIMLQVAGARNDLTDDYEDDPTSSNPNGRGDCVALIDHFEVDDRPLYGEGSVYAAINKTEENGGLAGAAFLSYGAMFTPYANYNLSSNYYYEDSNAKKVAVSTHYFPASFAYMTCLSEQLGGILPSYEAVAGVAKGSVKNIVFDNVTNSYQMCTKDILTNYIANHYNSKPEANGEAPISINGITQINPYGMVIYGTRTLMQKDPVKGVRATGWLNIRNMVSDIKKQMYQSARRYMYSANNDALWINFRSSVVGLLNQLQQGYGIKSYTLAKDMAKSTKYSLYVKCSIVPVYPVEKFDITIEITDEDIEVNES